MAFGVPSTLYGSPPMESLNMKSKNGVPMVLPGLQYLQYGTVNYNTSNTEASLLSSASYKGSLLIPGGTLVYAPDLGNANNPGCILRFKLAGSIKNNTSTPDITFRTTFTNAAGTVYTLTTGVAAMVSTAAVAMEFEIETYSIVTAYSSTAGNVNSGGRALFFSTGSAGVTGAVSGVPMAPAAWATTVDTTVAYTFDCKATFGTSHANNAIIVYYASLEILS